MSIFSRRRPSVPEPAVPDIARAEQLTTQSPPDDRLSVAIEKGTEAITHDPLSELSKEEIALLVNGLGTADLSTSSKVRDLLPRLGSQVVNALLTELVVTQDVSAKQSLSEMLGQIGDPRAVSTLIRASEHKSLYLRASATKALGNFDDADARQAVTARLADPDSTVKRRAVEALAKRPEPRTLRDLEVLSVLDETWAVRRTAMEAIAALLDTRSRDGEMTVEDDRTVRVGGSILTHADITARLRSMLIHQKTALTRQLDYDHDMYIEPDTERSGSTDVVASAAISFLLSPPTGRGTPFSTELSLSGNILTCGTVEPYPDGTVMRRTLLVDRIDRDRFAVMRGRFSRGY